jgi:protein SCO1/2
MRTLLSSLVVVVLGTATLAWATEGFRAVTAETARRIEVAEHPRSLPELPLQVQSGHNTALEALRGDLVVATFIYTQCNSMCPLLGVRMKEVREGLADHAGDIHLLSLSFDPERDKPARLQEYGRRYGARPDQWWVARPRANLESLLETFGVVVLPDGQGGFRHNAAFYLIDRQGRLAGIYPDDDPGQVIRAVEARL